MVMNLTVTAYVLVVTRVGEEDNVKSLIDGIASKVDGILRVESKLVFGEFDIVVIAEARDVKAINNLVTSIRKLSGVEKTITLIGI